MEENMLKRNNTIYFGSSPKTIAEVQQKSLESVLSG